MSKQEAIIEYLIEEIDKCEKALENLKTRKRYWERMNKEEETNETKTN